MESETGEPEKYTLNSGDTTTVVKAGDCVLMKKRGNLDPTVGRVVSFNYDDPSNVRVTVNWYYRPEETRIGRLTYHGNYEVFSTVGSHREICSAVNIVEKCFVNKLRRSHPGSELHLPTGPAHYFWRFKFDHEKESLDMSQVDRYCFCRMPTNPDIRMVQCVRCNDWYHPACLERRPPTGKDFQNRMICSKNCCSVPTSKKRGSGKRH